MYRNHLIFATTCFGLSTIIVPAASVLAATVGTVTINGQVPAVCAVVVTAEAGSLNIPDISAGDTNRHVATVNENCNNPDGYTMSVVGSNSANHTGLFVDPHSGDSHPFIIEYDNGPVPVGGIVTDTNAPGIDIDRSVQITYDPNPLLTPSAGFTYAETLTFTISAK